MTKHVTLLMYFIGIILVSYSKNTFQIAEINPEEFNNPVLKNNSAAFRFQETDFLVIKPKVNVSALLSEKNIRIQSYLGDGYYLIALPSGSAQQQLTAIPYDKLGYIIPHSKIESNLQLTTSAVQVSVLYASDISEHALNDLSQEIGFVIAKNNISGHYFTAYLNQHQLKRLAEYPFVYYIMPDFEKKSMLIGEGGQMLGVNQVHEQVPFNFALKGEGVNIGIWDDGAVGTSFDLPPHRNIVIDKEYSFLAAQNHTTYVAGAVGAAGNFFNGFKGVAPKCTMYFWDVLNDIVQEVKDAKTSYAVDISNHSYNFGATTCFYSGLYIPEASELDKAVYEKPTLLPVIAVGNSASTCAISDTFSSVDIGFQGCKNAITVGWLFANGTIVGNSGRGPTSDGRLKPELVAKGFAVQTMSPNNGFSNVFGSSFAAPMVAGLAGLMHQKYKQQFGVAPNAALTRAILCNTARDQGNPGPDYTFGFGIPDALRAVQAIDNTTYFEGVAAQNGFNTHTISVPSGTSKLSVTLAWTDKEGNPFAEKALVNDLDLKVVKPNGDTILPWKLNPAAYKSNAVRGVDNVNNIEQVTIENPDAGDYTLVVKGTDIPFGPQDYALAFNSQAKNIDITFPNGGEMLDDGSVVKIRWNSNGVDSLCRIEFSANNGGSWQTVVNNYPLSNLSYEWTVPASFSQQCLIRITSGIYQDNSEAAFSIGSQINYPLINHTVCDRTVKINWPAVSGASAYKLYLFVDSVWVNVAQTSLLTHTINNLVNGKLYMYAISTIKNGFEGNRSFINFFTPAAATCTTLNDVGVFAMNNPLIGRTFTSAALGSAEKLSFIIKNFGTAVQNSISVSYRINGGSVRNTVSADIVTAGDTSIVQFNVNENLSAAGNYLIEAWTNLPGDNNIQNDTLRYTLKHLNNLPLVLPFSESFENTSVQLSEKYFGIEGLEYADYIPEYGGRLRANEGNLFAKSGNRAIALDNFIGSGPVKKNELIFTYNLSAYPDSVVFLDFNYMHRNEPDGRDSVFARGSDTQPWIFLYDLYANRTGASIYKSVKELNLYQKLKIENGQNFSSSTQLKIVHSGNRFGVTPYNDGGYNFDDFSLYVAGRDVSVVSASVQKVNCSKSFVPIPVTVKIKNNSAQVINNMPVYYKVNDNTTVSEIITTPVNPTDTVTYTFATLFTNDEPGMYKLSIWASNPGDRYPLNDSLNTLTVIVMPTVDEFPYYNDLESDAGGIFTEGKNNSWVWTSPSKFNISSAAQDNKAWTTGVKGYNFKEQSYLYMGCFDFSALSADPLISFHFISIMGTQSDSAYAEYSTDGIAWKRLGCFNCGLNWYNGFNSKPYWDNIVFPWQTAHIKVPLAGLANAGNFMYRIYLKSDDFSVTEGLGIDDIHVLSDYEEMSGTDSAYTAQVSTGNGWIPFYRNGKLVAELHDDNKVLGNISLGVESNMLKQKDFNNYTIMPRNWVIKPQNSLPGNYKVRLYMLNEEYTGFVLEEDSISTMGQISLLRYIGLNTNLDVTDNHVRSYFKYLSPDEIQFYPYLNGYYIEFTTDTLGEFYLISTKQDADAIKNVNVLDFSAQKINDDVYLDWKTTKEINSKEFVIQYSFDGITFIDVDTVPAGGFSANTTLYNYLHELNATIGVFYYRIKIVENTNNFYFSLIDSVSFTPAVGVKQNTMEIKAYLSEQDILIDFKNSIGTDATINVYNNLGQLLFSKKTMLSNGIQAAGITGISGWSSNAYYLQIQTPTTNYYSKLWKP
jgi:hypothetical protein